MEDLLNSGYPVQRVTRRSWHRAIWRGASKLTPGVTALPPFHRAKDCSLRTISKRADLILFYFTTIVFVCARPFRDCYICL